MTPFRLLIPLLFLLASFGRAAAQVIPFTPRPPKALIVLLPYAATRINTLREQGDNVTAAVLAHDYAEMRDRMISDYRDNYSYGTFYFLPDSAAYNLQEQTDWTNLLLDANMKPVANPIVTRPEAETTVLVAQYGMRARGVSFTDTSGEAAPHYGDDYVSGIFPSLNLTDIFLRPFPRKMPLVREGRGFEPPALKHPKWVYYYRSKKYWIAYNHSASGLSARIARQFGPPGVKP